MWCMSGSGGVSAVQWACLSVCCVCVCDYLVCMCLRVSVCCVCACVCFCNYVQCVHVYQYACVCVSGLFMCPGSWWHLLSRLLVCLAPCPLTLQCRSLPPLPSHLPWGATSTQPNPFLSLPSGRRLLPGEAGLCRCGLMHGPGGLSAAPGREELGQGGCQPTCGLSWPTSLPPHFPPLGTIGCNQ